MAINSKGKITKAQLSQSLIDELTMIAGTGSGAGSVAIKKYVKTITSNTDRVFIGNDYFDIETDHLLVFKNSVYLESDMDYVINQEDYTISPIEGEWEASIDEPDVFNFICLMNAPGDVMFSGSKLINESVTEDKLSSELQYKINNINTTTTYKAEKTTILVNEWSDSINEDGLYTTSFTHGLSSKDLIISGTDIDNGRNVVISYKIIDNNTISIEVAEKINLNLLVVNTNKMEIVIEPEYAEGMITKTITTDMWVDGADNIKTYDINHRLNTKNLQFSAFENESGLSLMLSYKIIDENTIQVRSDKAYNCEVNISYRCLNQFFNIDDNSISENTAYSSSKVKSITGDLQSLNTLDKTNLVNAINETSNKISTLDKTENDKYNTINGIKEFVCEKDGYIDNILLEGKTLINYSKNEKSSSGGGATFQENVVTLPNGGYVSYLLGNSSETGITELSGKTLTVEYKAPLVVGDQQLRMCVTYFPADGSSMVYIKNYTYTNKLTFTVPDVSYKKLAVYINNTKDEVVTQEYNIVCVEGDYSQSLLPYFEGLKSLGQGDMIELKSVNPNLIDLRTNLTDKPTYFDNEIFENGFKTTSLQTGSGFPLQFKVKCEKNKDYILKCDNIQFSNSKGVSVYIYGYYNWQDGDLNISTKRGTLITSNVLSTTKRVVFNSGNYDFVIVGFYFNNSSIIGDYFTVLNLMMSCVDIPYVQHKYDKKQLLTTLRSTPNVRDSITKQYNKYYKIQKCGEITLTGSEEYNIVSNTANSSTILRFYTKINGLKNNSPVVCDKFKYTSVWNDILTKGGITPHGSTKDELVICIDTNKLSSPDVEGFKAWLQENPVTVVYELSIPIITEISNINLRTFSGSTSLLLNSGAMQCDINFEAANTLGSTIDILLDMISGLQQEIGNFKSSLINTSNSIVNLL